ncbi:polysaccharide deacetylase family protein [Alteromonas gilva]|uniref:Polysaccharide deacetylase family protein n=1 Tax=Alteromonas gilva TaxID=2987522 RepID=A0ABT5KX29_9ALTE|nr:polysaccharide deacetylase family protein [Alteromonas gilva]MDC8829306.1 polysaccharide deacetylase family protein [Alteromonas gilva]
MQFTTTQWGNALLLCLLSLFSAASCAQTAPHSSGVILLYHHVSADTPRSTSITPDQFEQHLNYIAEHYSVVALKDLVAAARGHGSVPDNALAITFDDGYENILQNGHPLLKKHGFPYTVFINPAVIGKQSDQLSWAQIATMQQQGATFANHTMDHLHLLEKQAGETDQAWLARVWQNISSAENMITEHTGQSLKYLAYPFGEYNQTLASKLTDNGYVAFGQHSGAVGTFTDMGAIPRFPAAGPYANLDTLKTKMASLAMPVIDTSLQNPQVSQRQLNDPISITLNEDAAAKIRLAQVACYFQGQRLPVEVADNHFEFTLSSTLPVGRSRVNCTAPSNQLSGRFYWYSMPFFVATDEGKYPD